MKPFAVLIIGLGLVGCAAIAPPNTPISAEQLTSGVVLFGEPVGTDEVPAVEVLAVDDHMRAFIKRHKANAASERSRLRRLLQGLIEEGYFDLEYDPDLTLSAAETFRTRTGNCLSFTNLFVALAREVGVDVSFQMVRVPPLWDSDDNWVILNNHINVVARNVRVNSLYVRDYVVDFNTSDYRGNYDTEVVDDNYAMALFHGNRAVESLRAGEARKSFAYLKKAIELDADVAGSWVNLGVLYARADAHRYAEAAYHRALAVDAGNKSALSNLARLHEGLGHAELAAEFRGRIVYYQRQNPYYHYHLAQKDFARGDFEASRAHLKQALRLKRDEHQFYFLRGLVEYQQGDLAAAHADLARAAQYTAHAETKRRYSNKLAALKLD